MLSQQWQIQPTVPGICWSTWSIWTFPGQGWGLSGMLHRGYLSDWKHTVCLNRWDVWVTLQVCSSQMDSHNVSMAMTHQSPAAAVQQRYFIFACPLNYKLHHFSILTKKYKFIMWFIHTSACITLAILPKVTKYMYTSHTCDNCCQRVKGRMPCQKD